MNCRYLNKLGGMFCVDESFDSLEDSDEYSITDYSIFNSTTDSPDGEYFNGDSQEGKITVRKCTCLKRIYLKNSNCLMVSLRKYQ